MNQAVVTGDFTCVELTTKAGVCITSNAYNYVFDNVMEQYIASNDSAVLYYVNSRVVQAVASRAPLAGLLSGMGYGMFTSPDYLGVLKSVGVGFGVGAALDLSVKLIISAPYLWNHPSYMQKLKKFAQTNAEVFVDTFESLMDV